MPDTETPLDVPSFPLHGDLWDVSSALWQIPKATATTAEERIALLEADLELRDLLARYIDALDSGDIDAIMSFIHDDCKIVGPRGTLVGKNEIRRDYEFVIAQSTARVHRATNVVVRLIAADEAWMASRNNAILRRRGDGTLVAVAAMVVDRLVKEDAWRMRQRRVAAIFSHSLNEVPFTLAPSVAHEDV